MYYFVLILTTLRRSKYLLPQETRLAVYYSHFHTHLTYMAAVWRATRITRLNELGRLKNKAIRHVFWSDYEYRKYGILKNILYIVKYKTIMTIFKIKNSLIKSDIQLPLTHDVHQMNTRRRSHFNRPASRTNYMRNSLCHEGVRSFNHLLNDIRRETNFLKFKKKRKSYFYLSY